MTYETPAFPCIVKRNTSSDPLATPKEVAFAGMTLRDYFAGQAITMCIKDMNLGYYAWAEEAYAIADAMMREREK